VADVGGEIEAVLTEEGADLSAGAKVVRMRSAGFRARFPLTRPEVNRAKRERLCFLWIGDRLIECRLANGSETDSFLVAEVAENKAGDDLLGKPARLIRALYRNAVEVPARAVIHGESSDRVWLVSPRGRVEPRPVTVAESDDESAILVQGLDGGDLVVADPLPSLSAGALIRTATPETYLPKSP
jgi:multidrug efflux pump subunit AcrA (membrane-fusion protein)